MERLTIRNSDGSVSQPTATTIQAVFEKLAAYEDTGLEPEEIKSFVSTADNIVKLDVNKLYPDAEITMYGKPLSHWQELSKAEQEGRLVVLPCKVGDTVWEIGYDCKIDYEDMCAFVKRGIVPVRVDSVTAATFLIGKIGTTVFFSREEAEKALEGGNHDN